MKIPKGFTVFDRDQTIENAKTIPVLTINTKSEHVTGVTFDINTLHFVAAHSATVLQYNTHDNYLLRVAFDTSSNRLAIIPVTDIQATPRDDSTIDVWRYGRNRTNFVKRGKNFNNMISLLDLPHDVPIYGTITDNILIFAANS